MIYCWVERHFWELSNIPVFFSFFFSLARVREIRWWQSSREVFSRASFPWQNGQIPATWYCVLTDTRLPAESCRKEKRNQKVAGGLKLKARVGIYLATCCHGTNAQIFLKILTKFIIVKENVSENTPYLFLIEHDSRNEATVFI